MLSSAIGRLRVVGLLEGASYLLLLGVAMPLKYLGGMPMAVRIAGMAHGILFIAFCFALLAALVEHRWSLKRSAGCFVASLLPFGTFVIDGRLQREQAAATR
jgi:integral membrane protein